MLCEKYTSCPFYNDKIPLDSGLGKIYKSKYCEGNNHTCARYRVAEAIGKDAVPQSLYPNMNQKADEILRL